MSGINIRMHQKDAAGNDMIVYPETRMDNVVGSESVMLPRKELLPEDVGGAHFINAADVAETGIYWGRATDYGWIKFPPRSGEFVMEVINVPNGYILQRITFTDNGEIFVRICGIGGYNGDWKRVQFSTI